jgi:hypothetical protein
MPDTGVSWSGSPTRVIKIDHDVLAVCCPSAVDILPLLNHDFLGIAFIIVLDPY